MFHGSFKDVSWKFKRCFKEVSRVFQGSLREISRVFKKVLRVFQLRLRGVSSSLMCVWEILMVFNKLSKNFQGSFKRVSRRFQGYFKIASRAFQGRFKGVSREISVGFKVNGVSSNLMCVWEISMVFNKILKKFKESFKGISRLVQGCCKEDGRVFQGRFQWVSRVFERRNISYMPKKL